MRSTSVQRQKTLFQSFISPSRSAITVGAVCAFVGIGTIGQALAQSVPTPPVAAPKAALKTAPPATTPQPPRPPAASQNPTQNPTQNPVPPAPTAGVGGGDVNLTPKRVVLVAGRNSGEIIIFNRGLGSGNYVLTLDDRVMTTEGGIQPFANASPEVQAVAKPGSAFVRISPRRVTLSPNGVQTVRVNARLPTEAPDGEYRAHFTVVAAPEESNGLSIEDAAGPIGPGEIRVRVVPRFGISIPIIVRKGATNVTAGIENLRLEKGTDDKPAIKFTITRSGNRSIFGDFEVFATSVGGARTKVGEIKGVAVYPEIDRRDVVMALTNPDAPPPPGSQLELIYRDDDFSPGATLATAQAVVR